MMTQKTLKQNKKGFTLIELMIATTIFAILLLVCMNTLVQISRAYYKGFTNSKTQEAARNIVDEISEGIQLSPAPILATPATPTGPQIATGADATGVFCIGFKAYTYAIDRKVASATSVPRKEIRNGLIVEDRSVPCDTSTPEGNLNNPVSGSTKSLLPQNTRIAKLSVVPVAGTNDNLWNVSIAIVYGDEDLVEVDPSNPSRMVCKPGTGAEFCALSEVSTTVKRRFGGS